MQDPLDYLEAIRQTVPAVLKKSGVDPADVVGLGIDFTSCTILPTLADGTPLMALPEWGAQPHAWVKLWKHHAAQPQADRINETARARFEPWLARYGGKYSSEWFFSKALQILEEAPEVYRAAERAARGRRLGGVATHPGSRRATPAPPGTRRSFRKASIRQKTISQPLHPDFADIVDEKMSREFAQLGERAGGLTKTWAEATGLSEGVAVAVANVDAHVTAPAVKATEPGVMVMIMGTVDLRRDVEREVARGRGHVRRGRKRHSSPVCTATRRGRAGWATSSPGSWSTRCRKRTTTRRTRRDWIFTAISSAKPLPRASASHGLLALDWWNGNRSTLVDAELSGLIVGMTLSTRAPDIYRALIEATAYGTREIIEAFEREGVEVRELVAAGGLPEKNALLRQIYADVTGRPLKLAGSAQAPALGSAMFAAVAAGIYPDIHAASEAMGSLKEEVVQPHSQKPSRVRPALWGVQAPLRHLRARRERRD